MGERQLSDGAADTPEVTAEALRLFIDEEEAEALARDALWESIRAQVLAVEHSNFQRVPWYGNKEDRISAGHFSPTERRGQARTRSSPKLPVRPSRVSAGKRFRHRQRV